MKIRNYDEIEVLPDSLVILDLDETIIQFDGMYDKWWEDNLKYANDLEVYRRWVQLISFTMPSMLDEYEFNQLIRRIRQTNSRLVILTARNAKLCEVTLQQLVYCNIIIPLDDIYFSDKKGRMAHSIKRRYTYSNVIFVDDRKANIKDVKIWIPDAICYHIRHTNLNKILH
jgi:phosphoglycolate phosphatase-like HAD superfamily hydrolase